jgi:hypothetical protein
MNTKGLALATFVFGVFILVLGAVLMANFGLVVAGSILMGSSLVALRMDNR